MVKVEEIRFDEVRMKMIIAVNFPIYHHSLNYHYLEEAQNLLSEKIKEIPEEIEFFEHTKQTFNTHISSPEVRMLYVYNYRRLTPEQLKDKKESERINHFVNNLIEI